MAKKKTAKKKKAAKKAAGKKAVRKPISCDHLLIEIGTEELPPRALKRLSDALGKHVANGLREAGLLTEKSVVRDFATPRRLAISVSDVLLRQADRQIEKRGPALQAAFDSDGNATRAAEGFATSCGTSVDKLDRLKTDKGEWLVFQQKEKGRSAKELIPEILEKALKQLPIPKRMR